MTISPDDIHELDKAYEEVQKTIKSIKNKISIRKQQNSEDLSKLDREFKKFVEELCKNRSITITEIKEISEMTIKVSSGEIHYNPEIEKDLKKRESLIVNQLDECEKLLNNVIEKVPEIVEKKTAIDISKIDEMPPSRKPVETTIISNTKINKVLDAVKRAINTNAKVYWVCPLIEESHLSDMAAAEERYALLNSLFPNKIGLIHGKLPPIEKDRVMNDFANGNLKILVATTVIEVGVNVPDASIMIIEHAERFGLAQLHQLRGRVGRGNTKSNCLLIYSPPLSETAKARLNIMRQTDNGFEIAEEDLKLRGAGEILGTKQSGMPEFKIADLNNHADLLAIARKDAAMIVHNNPNLLDTRGKALRTLLYLFSEDEVFRTIRSG